MRSAIFLSARNKSTRLKAKELLDVKGRTVIELLIERLLTCQEPDELILCTATHPDDQVLVDLAERSGIKAFKGSEDDKLDRYLQAARAFGITCVAVVDGDDLLVDPPYVDETLRTLKRTGADYVICRGLPLGAASFGLNVNALAKVCELKTETDTEVWGSYFTQTGRFNCVYVDVDPMVRRPEIRMTLDYEEDYRFFLAIYDALYKEGKVFGLCEIIPLLDRYPELLQINAGVQELYEQNLKKSAPAHIKES